MPLSPITRDRVVGDAIVEGAIVADYEDSLVDDAIEEAIW